MIINGFIELYIFVIFNMESKHTFHLRTRNEETKRDGEGNYRIKIIYNIPQLIISNYHCIICSTLYFI